jgi:hypothetical protein
VIRILSRNSEWHDDRLPDNSKYHLGENETAGQRAVVAVNFISAAASLMRYNNAQRCSGQ